MMFCFFAMAQSGMNKSTVYNLLVGTYTVAGKSQGIYVYSFDTETGDFSYKAELGSINNPSFFAITADHKNVYSVSEGTEGTVSSFSFNAKTGKLTLINSVKSGGSDPCYVSIDSKNKFVFVGNYTGGSVSAIPINADRSLSSAIQTIQHEGSGALSNQEKAHVHAAVLLKDNRYLFVPDLGTDKVNIYAVDITKPKPLTIAEQAYVSVAAGGGPRHFTFDPTEKYAYLIQEMSGIVTVYDYTNEKLREKQTVSMPADGFIGKIDAADIHISPDGKFLYGSMRGDINELGIYAIDQAGNLTFAGRQSTLGRTPRNFSFDPSGNFLLVANQNTDEIIIFKRDKKTGLLTSTGKKIPVGKPVCLKFVPIK
jgi:6-phosphogluconolactonase